MRRARRVFVGSFNGGEAIREDVNPNCRDLFHKEYDDLMEARPRSHPRAVLQHSCARPCLLVPLGWKSVLQRGARVQELRAMPQRSCDRKVNELVKRVRALRVHLLLLQHLKKKMPALMFKQSKAAKILEDMPEHFRTARPAPPLPLHPHNHGVHWRDIMWFGSRCMAQVGRAVTEDAPSAWRHALAGAAAEPPRRGGLPQPASLRGHSGAVRPGQGAQGRREAPQGGGGGAVLRHSAPS